ncbi:MAG: formyltransferase family protein [Methylotetracoccus sp.]
MLRTLLRCEHADITGIMLSSRVLRRRYGWLRGAVEQIRLSGLAYALYLWAATGLADALGRFGRAGAVASLAARSGIPTLLTRDVNGPNELGFVRSVRPDLLISAFFNQRIGPELTAIPRSGCINIHPSPLPEFRGVDPVFFSRLRDADRWGVTVHRIDDDFDTGAMLFQRLVDPPGTGDSVLRTTAHLFRRGSELIAEHLEELATGPTGHCQRAGGSYDSWPTAAAVRALHAKGIALARWTDLIAIARGCLGLR